MLPEIVYKLSLYKKTSLPMQNRICKKSVTNKELAPDESFRELNFADAILCNVTDFV